MIVATGDPFPSQKSVKCNSVYIVNTDTEVLAVTVSRLVDSKHYNEQMYRISSQQNCRLLTYLLTDTDTDSFIRNRKAKVNTI